MADEKLGGCGRASHDAHLRREVRAEDGAPGFMGGQPDLWMGPDFWMGRRISGWCTGLIAGNQICLALLYEGNLNA
jgi:hypothetical protein